VSSFYSQTAKKVKCCLGLGEKRSIGLCGDIKAVTENVSRVTCPQSVRRGGSVSLIGEYNYCHFPIALQTQMAICWIIHRHTAHSTERTFSTRPLLKPSRPVRISVGVFTAYGLTSLYCSLIDRLLQKARCISVHLILYGLINMDLNKNLPCSYLVKVLNR